MDAIETAKKFSTEKLHLLREAIRPLVPLDEMVLINGSFARREASESSDVDFYIVTQQENLQPEWADRVKEAIEKIVPISPAEDGAFYHVEQLNTLIKNIGGGQDN